MEVHIMNGITTLAIGYNYYSVPRIGDALNLNGYKVNVKVKDVIWHIDTKTWVEIQV